jgi:hypothetical protein
MATQGRPYFPPPPQGVLLAYLGGRLRGHTRSLPLPRAGTTGPQARYAPAEDGILVRSIAERAAEVPEWEQRAAFYQLKAAECREAAEIATDLKARDDFLVMANYWSLLHLRVIRAHPSPGDGSDAG